jgi:hypothetical protein
MAPVDLFTRQEAAAFPGMPTDPAYYTWSVQGQLAAIDLSLMIIASVLVVARVYIRVFVLGVFRVDDYFMVAAMICSILAGGFFLHVVNLGMGKHIFALPPQNVTPLLMWIFIVSILIPLAVCFVKLSIAFFLLSLLQRTRYRFFMWGIVVFLVVFMLFTFFTLVFSCIPIQANWNFNLRPPPMGTGSARCLSTHTYRNIAFVNSITNIVTDIVLAFIPVPLIWTLQVNKRTKASLIFILTLGFFACTAGIIKTPLLFHFFDDFDSTGNRSWYYAWQLIEMNVGIIAATLPSLNPAFRWLLKTAQTIITNRSGTHRTGPSTYRRKSFSRHYIPQKDKPSSGDVSYKERIGVRSKSSKSSRDDDGVVELRPYNVTVSRDYAGAGYGVGSYGDGKSDRDSGRGSDASSDAILRVGEVDGAEGGMTTTPTNMGLRGIVRTTKVTIVTS